jgi:cell wall-associated NlpC family hydrolase
LKKIIIGILTFTSLLFLPEIAFGQHYVQNGETLSKIAKEYQMSLKDIISLNPHLKNPNLIHPNDYIIVRTKTETKKDLVDYARSLQDVTAYKYGGQNPPYETDCSGYVQHIYKKFGVALPRVSRDQARIGTPVKFTELQLGDLMFFSTRADKTVTHVGIYMGNDFFISNLNEAKDVEVLSTWGRWSQDHFLWGTRYKL